jgi:hypothetical protein
VTPNLKIALLHRTRNGSSHAVLQVNMNMAATTGDGGKLAHQGNKPRLHGTKRFCDTGNEDIALA